MHTHETDECFCRVGPCDASFVADKKKGKRGGGREGNGGSDCRVAAIVRFPKPVQEPTTAIHCDVFPLLPGWLFFYFFFRSNVRSVRGPMVHYASDPPLPPS